MPRVKGGYVSRRRRKKVLKLAKGYFGSNISYLKLLNSKFSNLLCMHTATAVKRNVISVNFGSLVSTRQLVQTVFLTAV